MAGCTGERDAEEVVPEILCYCGITMILPMREVARQFEKDEHCRVKFIIDGSGNLYKILTINQKGDLYLPGSESYIERAKQEGLITDTVTVGFNQAVLVVGKGNPLGISPDLKNLMDKKLRIVLGSPESGSIGKESKRILEEAGIYRKVFDNISYLTTDSVGLARAIKEKSADLTINWYATTCWPENRDSMEAIPLVDELALKHRLTLGGLRFSRHPELVKRFLQRVASRDKQALFDQYGFQVMTEGNHGGEK